MTKGPLYLIVLFPVFLLAQEPTRSFTMEEFSHDHISDLKKIVGAKKTYPAQYERQILIALSYYPELKNIPIHFRIKKRHTPLTTRSSWLGLIRSQQKRDYVITISDNTEKMLISILYQNLPFNAQIGVIGHELGHVVEFSSMPTLSILKHAFNNVSSKYIDHFEFRTDSICIAHGLGYQLLAWSSYVRRVMHKDNWDGADNVHRPMMRERYMNPSTIKKRMKETPSYQGITVDNTAGHVI
ncbi:MAG TPA: hypothetical protein VFP87_08740 [Chitinophagaceae bacterium]|nr:hypothetical protein [Chitinophagaceae bacterium]